MAYDQEVLKKAQRASLKILLEVDRICRKHGIVYLMDAGTLLGAVRHQGFIPWDDDIDIAMTRDNYERFVRAVRDGKEQDTLPAEMELILPNEYRDGRAFYDFTPRIIFKHSRRHADGAEMAYYDGKLNHLWVDIFILDNIPDRGISDRMTRFFQKCIYGLSMPKRYAVSLSKYGMRDRIRVGVLTAAGRLFPMPLLFSWQEKLSKRYADQETKRFYYSNYQPDYLQVTVERGWCGTYTELPFEGYRLMAPKAYDKVLREIYGDYMKLPPMEQRVPSHSDGIEVWEEAENA